jgi:hypothetical protein
LLRTAQNWVAGESPPRHAKREAAFTALQTL